MDEFYLPRKIMRPVVVALVLIALLWGLISGDMNNAGKLMLSATEPISNRIENRLTRVLEAALPTSVSDSDTNE